MIFIFCTRRDVNGNRKYLKVCPSMGEYTTVKDHWLCRDDFIEVSTRDYRRTLKELENDPDYKRV